MFISNRAKYAKFCASPESILKALRTRKVSGLILWRGNSEINGKPIVLVATAFKASGNGKTGKELIQTFILPDPRFVSISCEGNRPSKFTEYLKETGGDSICGGCKHAWQFDESLDRFTKGACYVREDKSPAAVTGAVVRESYLIAGIDFPESWIPEIFDGRKIRASSYGDPAAVPAAVWSFLSGKGITGYSHQWESFAVRNASQMKQWLMASVDSIEEKKRANDAGWRTFRVSADLSDIQSDEMLCPASEEFAAMHGGRKATCDNCLYCSGTEGKGSNKAKPNVVIKAHGANASKFTGKRAKKAKRA